MRILESHYFNVKPKSNSGTFLNLWAAKLCQRSCIRPESAVYYYYNNETGESTFDLPDDYVAPLKKLLAGLAIS